MKLIYYHYIIAYRLSQIDVDVLVAALTLTGDYTKSIIFIKMSKKLYSPYNLKKSAEIIQLTPLYRIIAPRGYF